MRAANVEEMRRYALAWLLAGAGCTAAVDDGNPFSTVGMSGATTGASGGADVTPGSDEAEPTDADSGSTSAADGSSSESATTEPDDTSAGECDPPCDPQVSVCEASQCVPPGPPLPGDVVITELMPNPSLVTDDDGEWIELTNVGTEPVDLEGCALYDDGNDEDIIDTGAALVVPPGGQVVFGKLADVALNGGIPGVAYAFGTSYTLTNTDDEVRLECGGMVIDEVAYLVSWPFADGVAMQLGLASLDAAANDALESWCAASAAYGLGDLGTPGLANAGC